MVITPGAPPAFPSLLSLSATHQSSSDLGASWYTLLGSHPVALIISSFTFDTVGQSVLIVLLATLLLSPNVRPRNGTLINLLVVTLICSVPPALLYARCLLIMSIQPHSMSRFYADQYLNPRPPRGLCMVQAILKHGTDPM